MTDWTEYQDDISDAISDSMDMDWSANDGARAVVHWLNENAPQPAALSSQAGGAIEGESVALMRPFWVSWWGDRGTFELHRPWWVSGERDDGKQSICAAVLAQDEFTARLSVQWAHDDKDAVLEWRFVEEKPKGWSPFGDRFRQADWMRWPENATLSPEAPAREWHYGDPCIRCGVGHDDVPPGPCRADGITISRERAAAILDYLKKGSGPAGWPTTLWCEVKAFISNIESALATREEAPAGKKSAQQLQDELDQLANEYGDLLTEVEALRAPQPAREDAQPVARAHVRLEDDGLFADLEVLNGEHLQVEHSPVDLFLHPAPDALRVAAIAFRDAVSADIPATGERYAAWVEKARAARADLDAALQAEQKGGA